MVRRFIAMSYLVILLLLGLSGCEMFSKPSTKEGVEAMGTYEAEAQKSIDEKNMMKELREMEVAVHKDLTTE